MNLEETKKEQNVFKSNQMKYQEEDLNQKNKKRYQKQ